MIYQRNHLEIDMEEKGIVRYNVTNMQKKMKVENSKHPVTMYETIKSIKNKWKKQVCRILF